MKIASRFGVPALILTWLLLSAGASFGQIDYRGLPEWSFESQGETEYLLYTPRGMKPGKRYPIALFMHGCCGDDDLVEYRNAVDPPVRMWHQWADNEQSIPTYILAPATSRGWDRHFPNLIAAIDDLIENGQGDQQRVYVTGFSMGGAGTMAIIQAYPDYFAAALPMGMGFQGDHELVSTIPIWFNIGGDDWYGRGLSEEVARMRAYNGDARGGHNYPTGVNPRITVFEGVGHGVQWAAASTQDLVAWAYAHVNDGNRYPQVRFTWPEYRALFPPDQRSVEVVIDAHDPDGSIDRVEVRVNGDLRHTLTEPPYSAAISLAPGNNAVFATAFDNGGKSRTAEYLLQSDVAADFVTAEIPAFHYGDLVDFAFEATGNAPLTYSLSGDSADLPGGISLTADGRLHGVATPGFRDQPVRSIKVTVKDAQDDVATALFRLEFKEKRPEQVIVSRISGDGELSVVRKGGVPYVGGGTEQNFSDVGDFDGFRLIQTDSGATDEGLSFQVDEDIDLYVAYEVQNMKNQSTFPDWLKADYELIEETEIEVQVRYYQVFHREADAGRIQIPAANGSKHGVGSNYFVMLQRRD